METGRNRWIAVAFLAVLAAMIQPVQALAGSEHEKPGSASTSRTVVAEVNGQPIYEDQLTPQVQAELRRDRKGGVQNPSEDRMEQLKRKALDTLIAVELLYQASKDLRIPDMEQRVDEKMDAMRMRRASGHEGMGQEKIDEKIRESIRRQIRVQEYLLKNGLTDPKIPEEEIEAYYEKNKWAFASEGSYRARQICRTFDPDGTAAERREAREQIEKARQLILDGKPFEEVAREYSQCNPSSAGGEPALSEKGSMPPEFEAVAFSLDLGKLSHVVETKHAYYILEVLERTPEGTVPSYAETRDFIAALLKKKASPQRIAAHVRQLREEADIRVFLK